MALWITSLPPLYQPRMNKHPCCWIRGGIPKMWWFLHQNRSYTQKQHGGLLLLGSDCEERVTTHNIAHTTGFLRRFPRTVLLQKVLFHPNYQLSHTVQLLPLVEWQFPRLQKKLWQEMGFKWFQNLRNSEVPNPFSKSARTVWYCGVNLGCKSRWIYSFEVVDLFFVAPSCLYLLSRLIPVIKWIKSKWSKCRKIITTSHSCCVGKVKFAVPCMWIWWQSLNVPNISINITYYIYIYIYIYVYIYIFVFICVYIIFIFNYLYIYIYLAICSYWNSALVLLRLNDCNFQTPNLLSFQT